MRNLKPETRNSKLETNEVRAAGLCVPAGAGGGVCGRVFLAWLPESCHEAEAEPKLLGDNDRREQGAGCAGEPGPAEGGLEGAADLGVCADREKADRHAEPPAQGAGAETLRLGEGCAGDWETQRLETGGSVSRRRALSQKVAGISSVSQK